MFYHGTRYIPRDYDWTYLIIILILFVGRASAPKANGVPYNKGSRV